ncbi:hypothetical protein KUTeg_016696 [Tegillarca granosa]|uniref:Lipoxygenase homology domain-containing protein 1 n=1 Tax=Tegillarca granosa TaxID=220873 RepID=A0ABQ9EP61_TEGGR|nr:hypothetical protein KUTeg_016696 [Tegillarca granosa]
MDTHSNLRSSQTAPPEAKTCYFYKENDYYYKPAKVVVGSQVKSWPVLLTELSKRVPLSHGVRSVATPGGHDMISNLDGLTHDGHYVCSTNRHRVKSLNIDRVQGGRNWNFGRPPSGQRALNLLLREEAENRSLRHSNFDTYSTRTTPHRDVTDPYIGNKHPKKITVMKNGDPTERHVILLNRRTGQTFEQILSDMSEMFHFAIRKLYTMDGKRIRGCNSMFKGPDVLVCSGWEGFKKMGGLGYSQGSRAGFSRAGRPTQSRGSNDIIASRLKKRKERLTKTRGMWHVTVNTNSLKSAGTNAQVTLTIYGHRGNSGPITLGNMEGNDFDPGNKDEFNISIGNVGEIYKIRIGHDNTGDNPGWLCDEIRMKDVDTHEELVFPCHRWMARDEDDSEICREMAAVRRGEPILPVLRYEVQVITGNLWNAGTEANVYMTLYGDRGDTGVRQLYPGKRKSVFEKGNVDTFYIEAVSLGHLRRLIIGHDGTSAGQGWFLEKITVKEQGARDENLFYCGKWLDEGEDDGKIVRELKVQEEYIDDIIEKRNFEFEKWKFEKDCQIKLFSSVTEKAIRVKNGMTVDALANPDDKANVFVVVSKRAGMIRVFANVLHPNNYLAIDNSRVTLLSKPGAYTEFRVRVQDDKTVMFESVKNALQFLTFTESGKIGDTRGILDKEPIRRFHVYCKGIRDDMAQFIIEKHPEKGYVSLQSNLQRGLYIGMKPDGRIWPTVDTGVNNIWFFPEVVEYQLEQEVQDYIKDKEDTQVQQPLDSSHADGDWSIQVSSLETLENADVAIVVYGDKGNSGPIILGAPPGKSLFVAGNNDEFRANLAKVGKISKIRLELIPKSYKKLPSWKVKEVKMTDLNTKESLTFYFHRWLSREEEDLEIMREKPAKRAGEESLSLTKYKLTTITGNEQGSDTNAEVYVILYGEHGDTGRRVLIKSNKGKKFQCGQDDMFEIEAVSLGKLQKLIIGHDGTGAGEGWYLEKVIIKETEESVFQCDKWLDTSKEDRKIERTLLVKESVQIFTAEPILEEEDEQAKSVKKKEVEAVQKIQTTKEPLSVYQVEVKTGSDANANTNSNVYICIYGENGDSGKQTLSSSITSRKPVSSWCYLKLSQSDNSTNIYWYVEQYILHLIFQTDVFKLEVKDLGKIDKIVIGHDGKGADSGWYLDDVTVIKKEREDNQKYYFPCARWLDENVGDKKTEVELLPKKEEEKSRLENIPFDKRKKSYFTEEGAYKLWVKTAEDSKPANGGKVVFTLYGSKGKSEDITLFSANPTAKLFEPGNIDEFEVTVI